MSIENLSVCFCDITEFDKITSRLKTDKIVEFLQQIYKIAGDIIIKHDGKIHKYMGDALLFSFKDPHKAVAGVKEIAQTPLPA